MFTLDIASLRNQIECISYRQNMFFLLRNYVKMRFFMLDAPGLINDFWNFHGMKIWKALKNPLLEKFAIKEIVRMNNFSFESFLPFKMRIMRIGKVSSCHNNVVESFTALFVRFQVFRVNSKFFRLFVELLMIKIFATVKIYSWKLRK